MSQWTQWALCFVKSSRTPNIPLRPCRCSWVKLHRPRCDGYITCLQEVRLIWIIIKIIIKRSRTFDPFEVGTRHFTSFSLLKKNKLGYAFHQKVVIHICLKKNWPTDCFCTFLVKIFQQLLVIRGGLSESDSQWAVKQWGALWKPCPHAGQLLFYCL